jgi:hypothetical protein
MFFIASSFLIVIIIYKIIKNILRVLITQRIITSHFLIKLYFKTIVLNFTIALQLITTLLILNKINTILKFLSLRPSNSFYFLTMISNKWYSRCSFMTHK